VHPSRVSFSSPFSCFRLIRSRSESASARTVFIARSLFACPEGFSANMKLGLSSAGCANLLFAGLKNRTSTPDRCQPLVDNSFLSCSPFESIPWHLSLYPRERLTRRDEDCSGSCRKPLRNSREALGRKALGLLDRKATRADCRTSDFPAWGRQYVRSDLDSLPFFLRSHFAGELVMPNYVPRGESTLRGNPLNVSTRFFRSSPKFRTEDCTHRITSSGKYVWTPHHACEGSGRSKAASAQQFESRGI
jgi:hypothetical protein